MNKPKTNSLLAAIALVDKNNPTANNPILAKAVAEGFARGFREHSLFTSLKLINETADIKLLPEFLAHENPLVQEAAKKRLRYLTERTMRNDTMANRSRRG